MIALKTLLKRLDGGEIVRMPRAGWDAVASGFPVVETVDTGLAGDILLVKRDRRWAIVEEPTPAERVVRPLKTAAEARALIADRLAAYERMWDG